MLSNGSEPTNTAYFRPALGGDMAAIRGMAKFLLEWEVQALASGGEAIFDRTFIAQQTSGLEDYLSAVRDTPWEQIVEQSGMPLSDIELAARMYCKAKNVIMCWAMGLTQHTHSVPMIQEIVNLQLLRGNMGREGAGVSPVRGHSNVQGDRTMGINELPPTALLDALEARFAFKVPREEGHNTVTAIKAMEAGHSKVFIGLGGNFAQATPDTPRTHAALPPGHRQGRADPAVPGPHRHRHAGHRPSRHHGRRHVQHGAHFPRAVAAQIGADAFRACDHRRHCPRDAG
jgi:anaerobic selenocysteine-containing dehydrogenase